MVTIQRRVRGVLVRSVLRRNRAAVQIQRHVAGYFCRSQLAGLNGAALDIQRLIRGGLGRIYVRLLRRQYNMASSIIQSGWRMKVERQIRHARLKQQMNFERQCFLAGILQRYARGRLGRQRYQRLRMEHFEEMRLYQAATKVQSLVRMDLACRHVAKVRKVKKDKMHKAATHIRKMYLGWIVKKSYVEMREKFLENQVHVVVIQRYVRGFLVRMRIYRHALQAESEQWAAVEMQRMFRGYLGRLRWEHHYELSWNRHMACARIQTAMRRWFARLRVERIRQKALQQKLAAERRRFLGAQRIQKHIRGVLSRARVYQLLRYLYSSAVCMQRMWRGYAQRQRVIKRVFHIRAITIQARARGFLVRNRLYYLNERVEKMQKLYRGFSTRSEETKAAARKSRVQRYESSVAIQARYREHLRIRDATRTELRPVLRDLGAHPQELELFHAGQLVLHGSYRRIERKWSRAAVKIQRAVRKYFFQMDISEIRKVPFTHSALTRGLMA